MARLASPRIVNIEDLRRLARKRLPRAVFDYVDGGAGGEVTLRENCRAFEEVVLRPRHAVALAKCDLRTRVLGHDISFPAILAPIGYSRLLHPAGELGPRRAPPASLAPPSSFRRFQGTSWRKQRPPPPARSGISSI
jgi:isopentenyl diphosphate isomerase/L-lactate dehydrogenase-like FMN-dependent dehydrogenase